MIYNDSVDKDRLYFTQNHKPIRTQCPVCVRDVKTTRQCKIYKNLAALWWHIKQEHENISNSSFTFNDLIPILNAVSKAKDLGIIPEETKIFVKPVTTSSSLVYHGKFPRKDVYQKLEKVSSFFTKQNTSWPIFSLEQARLGIKMSMTNPDRRTIRDFLDCIVKSSKKNLEDTTIDVTQFCSEFEDGV
jgi:hypothetical protein